MKTNIALIGFMGVGKTTIGKILAKKLKYLFIEVDSRIEQKYGTNISQIFKFYGEIAFREYEIEAIKEISQQDYCVIASGGGMVLNQINIDRLKQKAIIVYLTASPEDILLRLETDKSIRPLLPVKNKEPEIRNLMKRRNRFYECSAEIKINTSRKEGKAIVEDIISELKRYEGFNFKK